MVILRWKKIAAGVYHATSPWGLYVIDGNNYGRNRWTVTYPDSDYGMADALAEAKGSRLAVRCPRRSRSVNAWRFRSPLRTTEGRTDPGAFATELSICLHFAYLTPLSSRGACSCFQPAF
jgi:hypothetical protein